MKFALLSTVVPNPQFSSFSVKRWSPQLCTLMVCQNDEPACFFLFQESIFLTTLHTLFALSLSSREETSGSTTEDPSLAQERVTVEYHSRRDRSQCPMVLGQCQWRKVNEEPKEPKQALTSRLAKIWTHRLVWYMILLLQGKAPAVVCRMHSPSQLDASGYIGYWLLRLASRTSISWIKLISLRTKY